MKKSVLGFTVAGVLLLGGFATTTLANDETTSSTSTKVESIMKGFKGRIGFGHKGMDSEELLAQAKDLGIETSGKDAETLMQEIQEALIKQEAKDLGIKTTDKDIDTLAQEVQLAKLQEEAKSLKIETDGKDAQVLRQEIRLAELQKEATELGVNNG
jgi:hypothetical protein